jgi:hypothetical protein
MDKDNPDNESVNAAEDTAAMPMPHPFAPAVMSPTLHAGGRRAVRCRPGAMAARVACAALVLSAAATVHARDAYFNVTSGEPVRPGVYGRIEVHGAPPPLISQRALVAKKSIGPVQGEPLYLYLPAGQVRKWAVYCQQYAACERPVYFVRVDNTPGKLGRWKSRERLVKQRQAATLSAQVDQRF